MKINFKVFLGFLGASVVLILTLSVIFYNDLFNILTNQYLSEKKQEIILRKDAITNSLNSLESEVIFLSNISSIDEYANTNDLTIKKEETAELNEDFADFINRHNIYNQISYIDETGREIVNITLDNETKIAKATPASQLQNIKDTYYFSETIKLNKGKIFASLVNSKNTSSHNDEMQNIESYDTDSDKFIINYSTPVFDNNNRNKGMLNVRVFAGLLTKDIKEMSPQENFQKINAATHDAKDEKLYIVDSTGYYIEHPDKNKEWGFLFNKDEKIQNNMPAEIEQIFSETSGQFFDKNTGTFITFYRVYPHSANVEKIHMGSHEHDITEAQKYIKTNNKQNYWVIILAIDQNSILNKVNILFYKTLSLLFLILLLFIVSMMWFFRIMVVEPLEKLRQGAQRIKRGNLDYQFDVGKRKDEIGDLANEFNSMAAVLKGYKETMEEQVNKRTADLEKFKLAVENAFDYVIITDTKGIILYVNKAIERITGFTRREVMGKKIGSKELWGGLMSKEFYENMWRTISEEKKGFLGEVRNRRKNGEYYNALLSITPILNKNHEIEFFISIERDITNVAKESY